MQVYKNQCKKIFNHYGEQGQKYKLAEECSELIRAIMRDDNDNIIEEMADVSVLLDQFRLCIDGLDEKIQKVQCKKVERQIERIFLG